jgi:hypothetical protein
MHLAHVTGWSHAELMAMPIGELAEWCAESVRYWNDIHAAPESDG